MAPNLFTVWDELALQLKNAAKVLLGFDFDGTLAPIVSDPEEAQLPKELKQNLSILAAFSNVQIAVISGRTTADLASRVGIDGIYYSGDHGLRILLPDGQSILPRTDAINFQNYPMIRELSANVQKIEGVHVDNKEFSLTVHYRNAEKGTGVLLKPILNQYVSTGNLSLNPGRKCWEIKQQIDWHKGKAYDWISRHITSEHDNIVRLYVGDDVTDEDVFGILKSDYDWSVLLPTDEKQGHTAARYILESIQDVHQLTENLITAIKHNKL